MHNSNLTLHLEEGIEELKQLDPSGAIERFKKAIECDPRSVEAYIGLGICYAMKANAYPAIDAFEKAIALSPTEFWAHFRLGELYLRLSVTEKGREHLRIALKCAVTEQQGQLVRELLIREQGLEKRRVYRPAFGKPFTAGGGLFKRFRMWFT
jgi:Tfp pilus assembly protein PilF